ncbi:uncharacterized protein LOC132299840 [Cornus florida]|uniref:uncharacterized protein LOC132299840 n=1 Tax=Cornus florida TaxID=4283 RepID=UPI00289E1D2A|nr:uncharacterized protein LOC132299840 [Cornus florida]
MATPFLLQSNIKWNPLLLPYPIRFSPIKPTNNSVFSIPTTTQSRRASNLSVKCLFMKRVSKNTSTELVNEETGVNLLEIVANTIMKAIKAMQKPAIAAVLVGLLMMYDPNSALAASGGRMGGRSFSSRSSTSSSSGSYSMRSSSPGFSSGFSYSVPYYSPSPFGPAVGVGVSVASPFFLIFMGFTAFVLVSGFLSDRSEGGVLTATEKTSVLKLQIGLLGMGRSLQRDLNRIAQIADTSTPEGLSYVLTETTLALLRHPDYCISGYSSVDVKRSMEEGEKRFNKLSIEERGKFDEETLVNVNNIKRQSPTNQRANGFSNEYIVITILVAAEGVHKLPTINSSGDLKEALQKLGSIPSSRTLAVEVLWTPQNENDTLSERELLEDYPLLRPL